MARLKVDPNPPRRVAVIGPVGAGKTTLSLRLGELLGLEVHHLDDHYWLTGEAPAPLDWQERERNLAGRPNWVIDGDHPDAMEGRLARAHAVVWLDPSPFRLTVRVLRRWWGNESVELRGQLLEVWRYRSSGRAATARAVEGARGTVYRLRLPRQARMLLAELGGLTA